MKQRYMAFYWFPADATTIYLLCCNYIDGLQPENVYFMFIVPCNGYTSQALIQHG